MSFTVLGLNSGTSLDAIDVALLTITPQHVPSLAQPISVSPPPTPPGKPTSLASGSLTVTLHSYHEHPFDPSLKSRILASILPGKSLTMAEVCQLNFEIGEEFANAVLQSGVDLETVDLIGSHGQTLWHQPPGAKRGSTLQMGEPAVIAARTGKTVVSDFRVGELANDRHGAPLSGFFEAALLRGPDVLRVSQNIGGIGNCSVVPPSRPQEGINSEGETRFMAFDTGPGNVLIDATIRLLTDGKEQYDRDGVYGHRGASEIDRDFVEHFLASPYFSSPPPKTTGRELFSDSLAAEIVSTLRSKGLSDDAIVATVTLLTSESIARAYEQYVQPSFGTIGEIYLCGGGALNPNIQQHLESRFPNAKIGTLGELGLDAQAKEACLFGVMGWMGLNGWEARRNWGEADKGGNAILGKITPGQNYLSVLRRVAAEGRVLDRVTMI